jgi:methylphosphotriester-DNA--protein-cysteine methyltransferase
MATRESKGGIRCLAVKLDERVCDQARLARDARFDGRFFIGVSTGIYCRPICPSPTSKRVGPTPSATTRRSRTT